jgi:hypothetical protein
MALMRAVPIVFLLALAASPPAWADAVVVVGGDATRCDFTSIEAAIAAASPTATTVVRLANDRRYVGVRLDDRGKTIVLQGGYADCDAAASGMIGDVRTVISGEAAFQSANRGFYGSVELRLTGTLQVAGTLTLQDAVIRGASGAGIALQCTGGTVVLRASLMRVRATGPDCLVVADGDVSP